MNEIERMLWLLAESALEQEGWMLALVNGTGHLRCCNELFRQHWKICRHGTADNARDAAEESLPQGGVAEPEAAAWGQVRASTNSRPDFSWQAAPGAIDGWPTVLGHWRSQMVRVTLHCLEGDVMEGGAACHCSGGQDRPDFISLTLPAPGDGVLLFAAVPARSRPSTELLVSALDQGGVAALITDADARVIYTNRHFSDVTGYTRQQMLGRNPRILQSGRTPRKIYQDMWSRLRAGRTWEGRVLNRRCNGEHFWSFQTISPLYDRSRQLCGYLSISHDSTAMHEEYLSLHQLAYYDSLCGVANRRALQNHLNALLDTTGHGPGRRIILLFLNLDNFKLINDGYGHEAGDTVLQAVCHRIVQRNYLKGFVARLGGDEFALVIQRPIDEDGAERFAESLLAEVTRPMEVDGHNISISASVGMAIAPDHARQTDLLMQCADTATRAAKSAGRNRGVMFCRSMSQTVDARIAERGVLTRALEHDELFPVFQPVIFCSERGVAYYESLVRWRHPELGQLEPMMFLPAFKQFGLLTRLNAWMLDHACAELSRLGTDTCLSLNIAAPDLMLDDYADRVMACLQQHGVAPTRVRLEITEGELIENFTACERSIARLRAAGMRFYIDDFGVGYASLAYLKRLPVDGIKLDRSFLQDFPGDTQAVDIIASVIGLAHRLGLEVTAEGVETMRQARLLSELGCDYLQGFLFGKPGTIDELPQAYL